MHTKRPTMIDVAKLAGVSVGTVSRVVNEKIGVKPYVKHRVEKAMRELNFAPNFVAQSMRTRSTNAVGCVFPSISIPFFARVTQAAVTALYECGYITMVTNTEGEGAREAEALNMLGGRRVDGILAIFSEKSPAKVEALIKNTTIPVVLIDRQVANASSVVPDHRQGVTQALAYLMALGHSRIAILIESEASYFGQQTLLAYQEAYAAAGLALDRNLVRSTGLTQETAYLETQKLLLGRKPPTAIVAGSFAMIGVLKAASAMGVNIPGALSLVSIGESDITELYAPKLTSVRWEVEQIGRTAAKLLLDHITDREAARRVITVPVDLVVRGSCAQVHQSRTASRA